MVIVSSSCGMLASVDAMVQTCRVNLWRGRNEQLIMLGMIAIVS